MREMKLRGKRIDNGEWVYGYFTFPCEHSYIYCGGYTHEVHPKTVGQYTGLKDKNGVEIYEGDKVKGNPCNCNPSPDCIIEQTVEWDDEECGFHPFTAGGVANQCNYDICGGCSLQYATVEVIGNIHEEVNA